MSRHHVLRSGLVFSIVLLAAGCSKRSHTQADFQTAINRYYQVHPACLWPQTKKFPVQAATADQSKTEGYDALTDAGLLTRTTAEKKVMIVASKQVNNYDISPQGRTYWTQDPTQPGSGNFCYGHREVTAIDNFTVEKNPSGGETAQVNYHFKLADVPPWAKSQEMQTAFPQLSNTIVSSQPALVTLAQQDGQWQIAQ